MSSEGGFRVLCLGDIVGRPARQALGPGLDELRRSFKPDLVVANGENSAGGLGIDAKTALEIRSGGVDIITLGDHAWQKKAGAVAVEEHRAWLIRPANYPPGAPGQGWAIWTPAGRPIKVAVLNVLGRVFINGPLDCPFRAAEALLGAALKDAVIVICDLHAEATSEKAAFARYFDGRMSLIFGTHTHVQTADEQILPNGTAFISDLGMCGGADGVIGMDNSVAINRFLSGMPHSYEIAKGQVLLQGVFCEIAEDCGKARHIERFQLKLSSK